MIDANYGYSIKLSENTFYLVQAAELTKLLKNGWDRGGSTWLCGVHHWKLILRGFVLETMERADGNPVVQLST